MTGLTNEICPILIRAPLRESIAEDNLSRHRINEVHRLFHALQHVQNSPVSFHIDPHRDDTGGIRNLLAQSILAVTSSCGDRLVRSFIDGSGQTAQSSALHKFAAPPPPSPPPPADAPGANDGWFANFRDPLVFPGAAADMAYASHAPAASDVHFFSFNSTGENAFLSLLDTAAGNGDISTNPKIKELLTDKELVLSFRPHSVSKRVALDQPYRSLAQVGLGDVERLIGMEQQAVGNNCKIRTKTIAGTTVGDNMLVTAEYLRNPLRGAAEKVREAALPGHPMTETEVLLTEIGNNVHDTILGVYTSGVYPIIKYGAAKAFNVAGHSVNGETACIRREFSAPEMAQLLFDTEVGITHTGIQPHVPDKLLRAKQFQPDGLFVQEHLQTGIHTEKYMILRRHGEEIMIKEKSPGNFVTHHPHATHPERLERRVFFDEVTRQVFFDQHLPEGKGFDFDIMDGRKYIQVHGQNHELGYNWNTNLPEIRIDIDGKTQNLPVYMEKLSHTWHLNEQHGRPVFNGKRQELINRIKTVDTTGYAYQPTDNLNPATYGSGKIYEVRQQGAFLSDAPLMHVIEMNGELVPVRVKVTPEHGVGYDVYDVAAPDKAGHAVEWNGGRWQFEQASSMHVSEPLKRAIGPRMFRSDIHPRDLSAPDRKGLQWDSDNNSFLKVKNHYVQLHHYVAHPDIRNRYYIKRENANNLAVRFRGNQFHKENHSERLSNILHSGLNGRGYTARDWLVEYRGGDSVANREWVENLLARYKFPQHSPATDLEFARHVFEWDGVTPRWAETYRVRTFEVKDVQGNDGKLDYYVNHQLGEGVEGRIYPDANDSDFVIKEYFSDMDEIDDIVEASDNFSSFYGDGASHVFQGEENIFMKMKKLDGKPLNEVNAFPPGAADQFEAMLHKLADKGIFHSDLKPDNILWDDKKKVFNPIDFGVQSGERLVDVDAEDLFDRMHYNTEELIHLITSKTMPH